jgi:hypothetical protein
MRALLHELSELDRWGRLDEEGKGMKASLIARLREKCGPGALREDFRNGHLCEILWIDEAFGGEVVATQVPLAAAIERSLEKVSPSRASYFGERLRYEMEMKGSGRIPPPGGLSSDRLALPERRAEAVLATCLAGEREHAKKLLGTWRHDFLLDEETLYGVRGDWIKRYPGRAESIRACP